MDTTQIGQAIVALIIIIGYVVQNRVQTRNNAQNAQKLQEIHVLVNSRLTEALDEIQSLKKELGQTGG